MPPSRPADRPASASRLWRHCSSCSTEASTTACSRRGIRFAVPASGVARRKARRTVGNILVSCTTSALKTHPKIENAPPRSLRGMSLAVIGGVGVRKYVPMIQSICHTEVGDHCRLVAQGMGLAQAEIQPLIERQAVQIDGAEYRVISLRRSDAAGYRRERLARSDAKAGAQAGGRRQGPLHDQLHGVRNVEIRAIRCGRDIVTLKVVKGRVEPPGLQIAVAGPAFPGSVRMKLQENIHATCKAVAAIVEIGHSVL